MNKTYKLPNLDKIQQRATKNQENCQRWDALISVTDDLINQLEV